MSPSPTRALACGVLLLFTACWALLFIHFCLYSSCLTIPATSTPPTELALFTTPSPSPDPTSPSSPLLTPSLSPPSPSPPPPPSPPSSPTPPPNSVALLSSTSLLNSSHPSDSSFTLHAIRGRGLHSSPHDLLHFCSFTHALLRHDAATGRSLVLLRFTSLAQHRTVREQANECWSGTKEGVERGRENELCVCFHPQLKLGVAEYEWSQDVGGMGEEEAEKYRVRPHPFRRQGLVHVSGDRAAIRSLEFQHVWATHKWVRHQHIAHWAQKLLMMQTVHQHRHLFAHLLPPVDALAFLDTDSDVSEHQQAILNASLVAAFDDDVLLSQQQERTMWATAIEQRSAIGVLTPIRRLSFTPHYGIFATHSDDTLHFRSSVYQHYGLPPVSRCPPPQVTFLYRHDRGVINRDAIIGWLEAEFDVRVSVATVNESTPSAEQVGLFARTGLLLSSHSSQLMNVLFSQPGSAVVELAPALWNHDFAEYAHAMGVHFQYALGGEADPASPLRDAQPLHDDCVAKLSACNGFAHCVMREEGKCLAGRRATNKNLAFIANLTAVQTAVRNAMAHLDWLCDGQFTAKWRS